MKYEKSRQIIVIAHDIRSAHNVGALLRTADGLGVDKVYFTGYTPYPAGPGDERLPHLTAKNERQISKTALGAEKYVIWEHKTDIKSLLLELKGAGFELVALEQAPEAVALPEFKPASKTALLLGREVEGIAAELLKQMDKIIEIPMLGRKESLNVVQATAIALYHLTYI